MTAHRKKPVLRRDLPMARFSLVQLKEIEQIFSDYAENTRVAGQDKRFNMETPTHMMTGVADLPKLGSNTQDELDFRAGRPTLYLTIRSRWSTVRCHDDDPPAEAYAAVVAIEAIFQSHKVRQYGPFGAGQIALRYFLLILAQVTCAALSIVADLGYSNPLYYVQFLFILLLPWVIFKSRQPPPIVLERSNETFMQRWKVEIGFSISIAAIVVATLIRVLS